MKVYKLDTSRDYGFPGDIKNYSQKEVSKQIPLRILQNLEINFILGVTNVGRDTLLESILQSLNYDISHVIKRCTNRERRATDKFMNFYKDEQFKKMITDNKILAYIKWEPNKKYYGLEKQEILNKTDLTKHYLMECTYLGLFVKAVFSKAKLILMMPESEMQIKAHIDDSNKNLSNKEKERRIINVQNLLNQMKKNCNRLYKTGFIDAVIVNKENEVQRTTDKILDVMLSNKRFKEI